MKELSIEQKAKRYDESLERAKDFMNGEVNYELKIGENIMCWVFPELRESEDERIRKDIISYLKSSTAISPKTWIAWLEKQGESDETKAKTILINKGYPIDANGTFPTYEEMYDIIKAGLEKQGEQKSYSWKPTKEQFEALNYAYNSCSDTERGNYYEGILETLIEDLHRLEKQGEQKPAFEMKSPEESLGIDSDTYNKIVDECIYGDDEQKPTDKVEPKFKVGDKIYLKPEHRMPDDDTPIADTIREIIAIDDKHYRFKGSFIFIEDQDKFELVEQKPVETEKGTNGNDREIPFSKQEWSEENEMMLDTCIDLIEHFPRPCGRVIGPWKDCIDWLKSLRPHKQWKPSEEQMKALRKAEATIGVNHVVLAGLISDLEKLTE